MVSSQVSNTPRNKVDFGGERIRLTINLETVSYCIKSSQPLNILHCCVLQFDITQLGFNPHCGFWDFDRYGIANLVTSM